MKELTKAQEEVLMALWEIKEGAVSDVLDRMPDPKPAYTTIATVIKVLEKKDYVAHKTFGKTNVYYPLVTKEAYAKFVTKLTVKGLFNGSFNLMVSSFVKDKNLSIKELEELKALIEKEINTK
jgi:predicted transcriptional regulator